MGHISIWKEKRQITNGQSDSEVTIMLERLTASEQEIGENETRQANERKGIGMFMNECEDEGEGKKYSYLKWDGRERTKLSICFKLQNIELKFISSPGTSYIHSLLLDHILS